MQLQMPTFLSWPLFFDSTIDLLTTDSLLALSKLWMSFSVFLTLADICFGGSLMLQSVDVILREGTHSGVSATEQSVYQFYISPFLIKRTNHSPSLTYGRMLSTSTSKMK
jgi:hypothetical protein